MKQFTMYRWNWKKCSRQTKLLTDIFIQ